MIEIYHVCRDEERNINVYQYYKDGPIIMETNTEYDQDFKSDVKYCPLCGIKSPDKIKWRGEMGRHSESFTSTINMKVYAANWPKEDKDGINRRDAKED